MRNAHLQVVLALSFEGPSVHSGRNCCLVRVFEVIVA